MNKIIKSNLKIKHIFKNNLILKTYASKSEIEQKLTQKLKIDQLEVVDTSGNCGSSFMIKIKSPDFQGKSVIAQHRMVNEILKDDLKDIHALQLKTEASMI
jgi:stress-induced morphogen